MARTSARWTFHRFDKPAPWLSPAEIDEAKRRNPTSRYLRLWQGVWSSREGDVAVSDEDLKAAVTMTGPMQRAEIASRHTFAGSLDLAWRKDRAAFVVLSCDHQSQRVRVAYAQDWSAAGPRDVDLIDVMATVLQQAQHFNFGTVIGDESQAVLMGQLLAQRGIRFRGVPQSGKEASARAMGFVTAFKERVIELYDHPALIRDLSKIKIIEKANVLKLSAERDETGHADLAFAVSFLLPAAVAQCRRPMHQQEHPHWEPERAMTTPAHGGYVGRSEGGFGIAATEADFNRW
ncbi:MAG: hypothetical protein ACM3U2_07000 [Deltaproteobacteria bacterium]